MLLKGPGVSSTTSAVVVNACLTMLFQLDGCEITTSEGLAPADASAADAACTGRCQGCPSSKLCAGYGEDAAKTDNKDGCLSGAAVVSALATSDATQCGYCRLAVTILR